MEKKVLPLTQRTNLVSVPITEAFVPNCMVHILTVQNGQLISDTVELVVPPKRKVLKVEVTAGAEWFKPGQEGTVGIRATDYEGNTGRVIIERFAGLDPLAMPAVLVAGHAPFTWGKTAADSVHNAVALDAVAEMALGTWQLDPNASPLEAYVLEKHYSRKHGPNAYYGQK